MNQEIKEVHKAGETVVRADVFVTITDGNAQQKLLWLLEKHGERSTGGLYYNSNMNCLVYLGDRWAVRTTIMASGRKNISADELDELLTELKS